MLGEIGLDEKTLGVLAISSVALFILSPIVAIAAALSLPADILHARPKKQSPLTLLILLLRNIVAIVLLCAGILMLFLPGQGVLTIMLAVIIAEFPFKHRIEQRILQRPRVLKPLNQLRLKFRVKPITLPKQKKTLP